MRPRLIGRTLGIGLRVAGRVVGQRVAEGAQNAAAQPTAAMRVQASQVASEVARPAARARAAAGHGAARLATGEKAQNVGRGIKGFLAPFQRVGGILWLEVTGAFCLIFVVAFAPTLWRTRASYAHGPDHRTFWSAAVVMAVFLYLSVSSFWKARRR